FAHAEEPGKGEALRPEVGKPLQAAQDLLKSHDYKGAIERIQQADAIGNKTAYESYIIARMRGAAAAGAGDNDTAAAAFDAVLASGKLPPAERLGIIE